MKILVPCLQCPEVENPTLCNATLNNDLVFDITCEHGHNGAAVLQVSKHQILFELGMMALDDGYIRESITSIAVALERFYEFSTIILCFDSGLKREEIDKTWSQIAKQSERQYGAYIFTNLLVTKRISDDVYSSKLTLRNSMPNRKVRTWKELRNAVTHNGEIPSKEEALSFAKITYDFILRETYYLKENHNTGYKNASAWVKEASSKIPYDKPVTTLAYPMMLDDLSTSRKSQPFEEAYEIMVETRKIFYSN